MVAVAAVHARFAAPPVLGAAGLVGLDRHDLVEHGRHRRVHHVAQARCAFQEPEQNVPQLGCVVGYPIGVDHRCSFPLSVLAN